MRRPLATALSLSVFLVSGALAVGVQFVPVAAASAAPSNEASDGAATVFTGSPAAGTEAATVADAADPAPAADDIPNDADMMFAAMMVPHHEQAIELSRILAATPDIDGFSTALAAFIERDQTAEIDVMTAWLAAWHEVGIMDHDGAGLMAGMATAEQIAELDRMSGPDAERRFLELMIAHHEGALIMAQDALERGVNTHIRSLAKHIASEQEREITAMTVRLGAM